MGRSRRHSLTSRGGAEETIQMGFGLLTTAGTYVSVGLVGARINILLFPFVAREFTVLFGATTKT
jgi:alcohol dehydrogenase, propanol-preferring